MNQSRQRGFTLIELLLAMTGIAFLLLFVVFAIMHTTNLFSKGVAIRDINQVGRQQVENLSRDIRYGSMPHLAGTNRLCVGGRAYIWNTPSSQTNLYDMPAAIPANPPVEFVVITTNSTSYCDTPTKKVAPADAVELLGGFTTLQELSVSQIDTAYKLYRLKMVISTAGTPGEKAPIVTTVSGENTYKCSPTSGQFCAFAEFITTVYARGN